MNFPFNMRPPAGYPNGGGEVVINDNADYTNYINQGYEIKPKGGSHIRRRPRSHSKSSRKSKKSSKRVFRKKSRATRRR